MKTTNKLVIFSLLIFTNFEALANCSKPVDPKSVMIFIDTNDSDLEIETAQKSACVRGETLIIVPRNYKELGVVKRKLAALDKKFYVCENSKMNCSAALQSELDKATAELRNITKGKDHKAINLLEEELIQLKEKGAKLKNLTISGHDGGGQFGGLKGSFSRSELANIIDKYADVNEVQSLHLLGCYTGVENEVNNWSVLFPKLRLIGGYDGSAPTSEKPAGHEYLKNLLEKENKILAASDEKNMISNLSSNLKSLNILNAGLLIKPFCSSDQQQNEDTFLYSTLGGIKVKKIVQKSECKEKDAELRKLAILIDMYNSGEKEPPKNSSSGEIRSIYNIMRQNEHCSNLHLNPKTVFGLLFHEGVKKSFSNYYKDELKEIQDSINQYDKDYKQLMENLSSESIELDKDIAYNENLYKLVSTDLEAFQKIKQAQKDKLVSEYNEMLKVPEIKSFAQNNNLTQLSNNLPIPMRDEGINTKSQSQNIRNFVDKYEEIANDADFALQEIKNNNIESIKKGLAIEIGMAKRIKDDTIKYMNEIPSPQKLNKLWIPTAENIKNKSRKEIMQNAHYLNELIADENMSSKLKNDLRKLNNYIQQRLIMFENPFSWHEYSGGNVERPEDIFHWGTL